MKVIHYIPSIDRTSGGTSAYIQLLTIELGKLVDLHVVTHHEENPLELENCTIHFIEKNNNPFSNKGKVEFVELLNEIRPDVFHTNGCWLPMSARTAMWAKELEYKVVYTPHGMLEPWIMKRHYWTKKFPALLLFQKKGVRIADVVHVTAKSEKENFMRLGWNKKVEVVSNCVQVEKIVMKESWKRKGEILFLSRIHMKKGVHFLIEAVSVINEEYRRKNEECPISRCIVAGEGDAVYMTELRDMASRLGVRHIVDFVGGVYDDRKWELLRSADLLILPTYSENFGIVVAEALACGTPVITTKGAPWRELEEYNCGWWTDIGSNPIVGALRAFFTMNEKEIEIMGRNSRKLVEEKYSCQEIAKRFIGMYNNIIQV